MTPPRRPADPFPESQSMIGQPSSGGPPPPESETTTNAPPRQRSEYGDTAYGDHPLRVRGPGGQKRE